MSVICVRIRGCGSEVTTTPYHIPSDFHLKQLSYHNGFLVLFLRYLSHKHKTYRYSVQPGTLGIDRTIFGALCLSARLYICPSVILSVCQIFCRRYLLNRSTIFNQTWYGGLVSQGGVSGTHTKKMVHYHQCQGHSEGFYNQNMTISTISSKLLVCLQPNLVSRYGIIGQRVLWKKLGYCVQGKGHSKG